MNNLEEQKLVLSRYAVEVHHKSDEIIELEYDRYSFEDVFESITEYYSDKNDEPIDKVIIKVKS